MEEKINSDVAFLWTKLYKSISSFEFIIQKVNTKFGYESNHTCGGQIPCANYINLRKRTNALAFDIDFVAGCATRHSSSSAKLIEPSQLCVAQTMASQKRHKSHDLCSSFAVLIIITAYKLSLNPEYPVFFFGSEFFGCTKFYDGLAGTRWSMAERKPIAVRRANGRRREDNMVRICHCRWESHELLLYYNYYYLTLYTTS